jgi:aspartate aminotransferase-like enzyme
VRPEILEEMTRPMIGHRSNEFKDLFGPSASGRRAVRHVAVDARHDLFCRRDACGARELRRAARAVTTCGAFSERWYNIAESLGYEVDRLDAGWGLRGST